MRSLAAANAYQRSSSFRNPRQQEAELFALVNAALRKAQTADPMTKAKAIADNMLLWITVMDLLRDPSNMLPIEIRGAILSVGHSARREMAAEKPDVLFLVGLNEQLAAGLGA